MKLSRIKVWSLGFLGCGICGLVGLCTGVRAEVEGELL
jgi:hypothetical protein